MVKVDNPVKNYGDFHIHISISISGREASELSGTEETKTPTPSSAIMPS
ncbi:hypothetical protein [Eubacterium pyruvativorans]|nr:hypothetical protein [Eubacterium pyruvativorans]